MKKNFPLILLSLLLEIIVLTPFSAKAAITSYLGAGSRGPQVTELQQILVQSGFYHGPITGYFGVLTRNGLLSFQAANNIPAVGIVGPITRGFLNNSHHVQILSVASVNPVAGPVGIQVTIKGFGFSSNSIVNMNQGFISTVNFIDSNTLAFTIPSGLTGGCRPPMMCPNYLIQVTPGAYTISVSDNGMKSNEITFNVTDKNGHKSSYP